MLKVRAVTTKVIAVIAASRAEDMAVVMVAVAVATTVAAAGVVVSFHGPLTTLTKFAFLTSWSRSLSLSLFANYTLDGVKATVAISSTRRPGGHHVVDGIVRQRKLSAMWLFSPSVGPS